MLGIGSTLPIYERTSHVEDAPPGTLVKIRMENGRRVEGAVQSQPDPLVVRDDSTGKSVTLDPASNWTAEKQVGSHWAAGAIIGAVVDVTLVVVGLEILTHAAPNCSSGCNIY